MGNTLLPSQTNTQEMHDAVKLSAEYFCNFYDQADEDNMIERIEVFFEHGQFFVRAYLKEGYDRDEVTYSVVDREQSTFDLDNDIPGFEFEELG